ncbi:MAG TPA: class I tRNA ligase family protein, partial [Candidatus Paceibacterota bacterium]|nr:class I tRNA ligase family protein [Candidatus Paceibacterota bacterium]
APSGDGWTQDEDTLDTWFSSGLWTFSTLGWPEQTADFKTYHPTTLIQPGTEILFFWVARMILMTGYALGTIPFEKVLLNGIVRDSQGRKFSKSLGNGGDPIEVASRFGADAIRFYFCSTATPGTDSKLYEDKIKGYKNFGNKVWNITRFVLSSTSIDLLPKPATLSEKDTVLLAESDALFADITKELDEYHLHLATEKLYHYIWHTFADIIIEESKPILFGDDTAEAKSARESRMWLLQELLRRSIIALHPFMPHVTEELWSIVPKESKNLLIATPWFSTETSKQS